AMGCHCGYASALPLETGGSVGIQSTAMRSQEQRADQTLPKGRGRWLCRGRGAGWLRRGGARWLRKERGTATEGGGDGGQLREQPGD
ncbi:unnamed protein product, partial [Mycena citricolor]